MAYALRFAAAAILTIAGAAAVAAGLVLTWFVTADGWAIGCESLSRRYLEPLRLITACLALGSGLSLASWMIAESRFSLRTLIACIALLATALALLSRCATG